MLNVIDFKSKYFKCHGNNKTKGTKSFSYVYDFTKLGL
jgi:hypothetical protein